MQSGLRAVVLAMTVALGLASSCQDPCRSCAGCCDQGECLPGTAPGACGVGGAECRSCGMGKACSEGACVDAPDAGPRDGGNPALCNCITGCCRPDGGCAPGNLPDMCGPSGRFCTICPQGSSCPRGTCESTTGCSGCLDALGVCRNGFEPWACGARGAPCQGCVGTDTCQGGTCVGNSTCSTANCPNGCCASSNICVPPSALHCGTRGSACVTCPDGGTCVGGVCE